MTAMLVAIVLMGASAAADDIIDDVEIGIGDTWDGNSWGHTMYAFGAYDSITVYMVDRDAQFENVVLSDFRERIGQSYEFIPVPGWIQTCSDDPEFPDQARAEGDFRDDWMYFDVTFRDPAFTPLEYRILFKSGDEATGYLRVYTDSGFSWQYSYASTKERYFKKMMRYDCSANNEHSAPVWLGMAGLSGAVLLMRRFIS
jgi:uncharacterized protein (TIGR03382 family)